MAPTLKVELISTGIYLFLIFVSVIIAVMGSMFLISYFTSKEINEKEEIVKNRNVGIALVLGSFIWTIGRMCNETLKPIMNSFYSNYASGFTFKSVFLFILGALASLLIALIISAIVVFLSIRVLMIINKDINEWMEIRRGNTAVAIIIAITVIVVGLFFESVVSYSIVSLMRL